MPDDGDVCRVCVGASPPGAVEQSADELSVHVLATDASKYGFVPFLVLLCSYKCSCVRCSVGNKKKKLSNSEPSPCLRHGF